MTVRLAGALVLAAVLGAAAWTVWVWWRTPAIVRAVESEIEAPIEAAELPAGWIDDLLAVEDPAFRTHHGIDFRTPGAGWTTIPQGLAKDLYFDAFRPGPLAKLEQSLAAIALDARISKERQLRLFLNRVYLGETEDGSVHGIGPAARAWLGKDVRRLEREEFLSLVAMIVGPNEYAVTLRPGKNAERRARIERLLAGACRPDGWRDVLYEGCAGTAVAAP